MDKENWLIDCITQDIIAFIVEDAGIEYDKAMSLFYKSKTFEHLTDRKLDLYRESASYIYQLYLEEKATTTSQLYRRT